MIFKKTYMKTKIIKEFFVDILEGYRVPWCNLFLFMDVVYQPKN